MAKLFSNFDTRQLSRQENLLLEDFSFNDQSGLGIITAKKGFVTDYASIDALYNILTFLFYALLMSYGDKGATIHDWLYSGYGIEVEPGRFYYPTRKECDQIFYRALRAEGIAKWRAWIFYAGVRLFAKRNFSTTAEKFAV